MQVLDPHLTACAAPLDALSLIEPPSLFAKARAFSDPEAVLVTAGAEVEGPAPDIVVVVFGESLKKWGRCEGPV